MNRISICLVIVFHMRDCPSSSDTLDVDLSAPRRIGKLERVSTQDFCNVE
jgi:hypothetical protein